MNKSIDITIIGAGVVGCAIAYELSRQGYRHISVIEKNPTIPGLNQSSRNAGAIHTGIYYPTDIEPLKAKLCVEGCNLLYDFCKHYGIAHKKTGKIIVAMDESDEKLLDFLLSVGVENGVSGLRIVNEKDAKKLEPNLGDVSSALFVPNTGVVAIDPLVKTLKELAQEKGAALILNTKLEGVISTMGGFRLNLKRDSENFSKDTDILINAAGLYSDDVARMVNPDNSYKLDPARGELFFFDKSSRPNIFMNGLHVYTVPYCYDNSTKEVVDMAPDEMLQFLKDGKITKTLGVHLSPTIDINSGSNELGNMVSVGPLKTLNVGKEDYTTNLKKAVDCIKKVHQIFPNLHAEDLQPRFCGIMAVLAGKTDFVIEKDKRYPSCINLVGMDSPALTACLAIARYVAKLL